MKDRLKWIVVLLIMALSISGCLATTKRVMKNTFLPNFVPIPPPQAGLVLPINRSPGVWAECWLFEGRFREKDLIVSHPVEREKLMFTITPLKHFCIDPPMSRPYKRGVMSPAITVPLLLSPYPADYTLLVFHRNFRNWVVRIEIRRFSTSGYPFNDPFISGGRKIYADRVIKLARVKPYGKRRFRFHRIYYPGDALGF